MKRVMAICAIVALMAMPAYAATVSINLQDGVNRLLAPADSAGVVPAINWNNHVSGVSGETGPTALLDDSAAGTGLSVVSHTTYGPNTTELTAGAGPNVTMMSGMGLESISISGNHYGQLEVSGGVHTAMGAAYDVYVYFGTAYNSVGGEMGSYGNIVLSGAGTYTNTTGGDVPAGTAMPYRTLSSASTGTAGVPVYDAGVGFLPSDGATPGNYVMFPGVTEETLVITGQFTGGGTWFPTVNIIGVQIVGPQDEPEPVIPEPAGLGLVGLALLGLRRRRS